MVDSNSNGDSCRSFQQYKLYVKSMEKVDDLRARASKLLVILNSAIFSAFAYGLFELIKDSSKNWKDASPVGIIIGVTGMALSFVWSKMICDYKELYDVKSSVVEYLEENTPERVYTREWDKIENAVFSISNWEKCLAKLFFILYGLILLVSILCSHSPLAGSGS